MSFQRVLVLCTGNICRSPMAEAVLRQHLLARFPDAVVESAGTGAVVGAPAEPHAVALMSERGLDITAHRGRQINADMIREFPLLLVMEPAQQRHIESLWPHARGRVHGLGRWSGFHVPDPFRGDRDAFAESLAMIDRGIDDWTRKIWL